MNPDLQKLLEEKAAATGKSFRDVLLEMLGEGEIAEGPGVLVTTDGETVTATDDDEEEEVVETDPSMEFRPVVVEGDGVRDPDPVFTKGCPACERGAPRKGALHSCGRSNEGHDPTPRFVVQT